MADWKHSPADMAGGWTLAGPCLMSASWCQALVLEFCGCWVLLPHLLQLLWLYLASFVGLWHKCIHLVLIGNAGFVVEPSLWYATMRFPFFLHCNNETYVIWTMF